MRGLSAHNLQIFLMLFCVLWNYWLWWILPIMFGTKRNMFSSAIFVGLVVVVVVSIAGCCTLNVCHSLTFDVYEDVEM